MENQEVINYIHQFDQFTQDRIQELRKFIKSVLLHTDEIISYGIITYKQKKNLFHIGGYKHHIGVYPSPDMILKYQEELEDYKTSKGTFQIQHHQEIPWDLIKKMLLDISNNLG